MSDDPAEPGWRPEYTGNDNLGNVGSGTRLGAHLYYLYRAGRNELPEVAAVYADLTRQVHELTGAMEAQFDRPGRGMHQAHVKLLELREETQHVFRQNCIRMQEVGKALVETASDYATTDQQAADAFAGLLDDNADDYQSPPPYVPEPPRVDDPPPPQTPTNDDHLRPPPAPGETT